MTTRTKILGLAVVALVAVPAAHGAKSGTGTPPPGLVVVHVVYDGHGTSTERNCCDGAGRPLYMESTSLSWHMVWDLDLGLIPKHLGSYNTLVAADPRQSYLKGSTATTTNVDPPCNSSNLHIDSTDVPTLSALGPGTNRVLTMQALAFIHHLRGGCGEDSLFTTVNPLVAGEPQKWPLAGDFKLDLDAWGGQTKSRFLAGSGPDEKKQHVTVKEDVPWTSGAGDTTITGDVKWSGTITLTEQPYVALGDSYSAGEGVPPFIPPTGVKHGCHRSEQAYPELVAKRASTDVAFVACSGATEPDLEDTQLPQVTKQTRLVTLTIGGNDVRFAPVVTDCLTAAALGRCKHRWKNVVFRRIAELEPVLAGLYRQIHHRAPEARILVLGYPNFFPSAPVNCFFPPFHIRASDVSWLSDAIDQLDATIDSAVKESGARGAEYLDTSGAFRGHDICGEHSWFVKVELLKLGHKEYFFHPNETGQRQLAKVVEGALGVRG